MRKEKGKGTNTIKKEIYTKITMKEDEEHEWFPWPWDLLRRLVRHASLGARGL